MANGDDPFKEFELQRQRARQRARAAGQEATGAVKRRFAALGGISGGAAIKQEQLAKQRAQQIGEEVIEGIDTREAAEKRRIDEIEKQREFVSEEAEKGRLFSRGERLSGQDFSSAEALKGRDFSSAEALKGREFSSAEALKGREFQRGESELQRMFVASESLADRTQRMDIANRQFEQAARAFRLEQDAFEFNKQVARWEMDQPTDLFGQLLGPEFSTGNLFGSSSGGLSGAGRGAASGFSKGTVYGGPVGGSIGGIVGGISGFCFVKGTKVDTENGPMEIESLEIGNKLSDGSYIYSVGSAVSNDLYNYNGVEVTGSHAVIDNGKWVRVKDTEAARINDKTTTVYYLSNTSHILNIEGNVFADFDETDDSNKFNEDERLDILNSILNKSRGELYA